MRYQPNITEDMIFSAGQWVPPGTYREVRSGRVVRLDCKDMLPATFDGRVACYVRIGFNSDDRTRVGDPVGTPSRA